MNSDQTLKQTVETIKDNVRNAAFHASRNPDEVTIVAVSKTKPVGEIRRVYQHGFRVFGESKVQEAEEKINACQDLKIEWHLIGHLQSNKVKKAVQLFDCIHSVDSIKLAEKINSEAKKLDKIQTCFLQINVSGEASKYGIDLNNWNELVEQIKGLKNINCIGLMTIPPKVEEKEDARPYFRQLAERAEELVQKLGTEYSCLSMGMSSDYEIAVQEGATHIRIGTALFGHRDYANTT